MRVYFYDTKSGIYQGEGFEVEQVIDQEDGVTTAKPPAYEKGEIPVFDPRKRQWRLQAVGDVPLEGHDQSDVSVEKP